MFFLNIFVRRFLKENNYGSFSETKDKKKDEIFRRNVRTGKYMETLTLSYNGKDKIAKAIINLIIESGVFDILREDEPNEETIAAIKEAHNEKSCG